MKKHLISLLIFLGFTLNAFAATVPTTGFVTSANCSTIANPAANQTFCLQTTTAGGRVAGGIYVYNGSSWVVPPNTAGGTSAPSDATYITQTANSTLTAEQPMASLGTGLVKNATGTGVQSIASAGTDYAAAPSGSANTPLFNNGSGGFTNGTRSGNTTSVATTTGSLTGGNCAEWDASGNIVASSGACGIAGAGYATIQEEGSNLTARTTMNFIGSQVTAADDAGNTRTNITVAVTDANISTTDVTTNDVSTSKHGWAPKGDGDTSKFLNANGAYSTPAGGGALVLVDPQTLTAGNTDITFSGLDGNTDVMYRLMGVVKIGAASTTLTFLINGATTNISYQRLYNGGADTTANLIGGANSGAYLMIDLTLMAKANPNSQAFTRYAYGLGIITSNAPAIAFAINYAIQYNDTSTNITSIAVHADQSGGLADGSYLTLYKYSQS